MFNTVLCILLILIVCGLLDIFRYSIQYWMTHKMLDSFYPTSERCMDLSIKQFLGCEHNSFDVTKMLVLYSEQILCK